MRKIITMVLLLIIPAMADAQLWKRYRYEVFAGMGTTNFLGELGGGKREPARFMGVRDIDFFSTRPLFHAGLRYKIYELLAVKLDFNFGIISGDDKLSQNDSRRNRNLHFKSNIFEVGTQLEFYVFKDKGRRYISQKRTFLNNLSISFFSGFGFFTFNPKAKYKGHWYELRPLSTEGQGLPSDPSDPNSPLNPAPYEKYSFCIPIGIAFQYRISRRRAISLEIANRYTFTDYIDDVSTSYYDNETLRAAKGEVAAALADPHIRMEVEPDKEPFWRAYPHGSDYRGDEKHNDAYIFISINYIHKLRNTGRGLPKF